MKRSAEVPLWLIPLRRWIERSAVALATLPDGLEEDFTQPVGEPALVPHDSVSWEVFRNPVSLLIGGTAAVVLELAEPRVRTGVYEHSAFRSDPLARLRRTGRATMVTVYGARSHAEAMIARVCRLHVPLHGVTPGGQPYRATDPELLTWVFATASYGFLQARDVYVAPIGDAEQDRFYREGQRTAELYGATRAPRSQAEMEHLFEAYRDVLEPSALVHEFLDMMGRLPLLPRALMPVQRLLIGAAVELIPDWVRTRLALNGKWRLRPWQMATVRVLAASLDRVPLRSSPPVQACRRLGLPDDYLYGRGSRAVNHGQK